MSPRTARRVLLVVAVEHEAVAFPADLPVLITGVGKVNAALQVSRALARPTDRPDLVVNIGTAGALHDGMVGTHVVGRVQQHDLDSTVLEQLTGHRYGRPILLGDGPTLATGDMFVSDAGTRDRLAAHADLVDMEGYAVAAACRMAGVPVTLVKHVSDTADEGARTSWLESVHAASGELATWLAANFTAARNPARAAD
ncbi:MAG: nucleosidase [Jiangellales bacterium]